MTDLHFVSLSYAAQADADLKSLQERIAEFLGSNTAASTDPTVLKYATVEGYPIAASTFGDHLAFLQEKFGGSMSTTILVVLVGDVGGKLVPLALGHPCNTLVSVAAQLAVVATADGTADSSMLCHFPLLFLSCSSAHWEELLGF
jgi:hypothetical protein